MSNKEVHGEADEETDTTGSDRSSGSHDMEEALSTDAQKRKGQSTSSVELPHIKKVESKNELAFVVKEMSDSLQEFLRSSVKRLDVKEVIDELKGVPDLDRKQRLKAINWLIENETQFSVVKNLPIDEKKDYILMFMP
ncbi:Myb/SANT-like DNA-binding domain protein [Quillaja saponaria]|uniref:Myb/SANT-like DNA-binding domain protein n=1 Tax=Quillaja saponaria TaxID=32244 RepID=A0AAD7KYJ7_QUISA|nr:Myb/SANT-like DNA-binding domain protein [Quillaja saponaria]KAJ7947320.1 Myb/SANT-like DNA-binding domain protein [Quillaja saponaria]